MGAAFDAINDDHRALIEAQPVFFVASAPTDGGHVNLSPKGYDTFAVLGPKEVAYADLTGSGAETIAHLRQDGRITVMFCSFDERPAILRLYGHGEALTPDDERYAELAARVPCPVGTRAIVGIDVHRVSSSCGYAVPRMELVAERPRLVEWAEAKGPDELEAYRGRKNARSIDGLPALGR